MDQLNARGMPTIDEHPEIDGASVRNEALGAGMIDDGARNVVAHAEEGTQEANLPGQLLYGLEQQRFNQLELNSMVSEHNSVMGSSPIKASRSTRSRIKKPTADVGSKKRPSQPDFDQR